MSTLAKLFDHLVWADERVCQGLRASPGSEPRAIEIYAHIVGVEHVWLSRIKQETPRHAIWPQYTVEECAALAADNAARYRELLSALTPQEREREVPYKNSAGQFFRSTVEDILLQVALHGTYHRGQVALLVRASGGEPAPTDYIALARGAPAATSGRPNEHDARR